MPSISSSSAPPPAPEPLTQLPFHPVTRQHILHCSYDYWHPKYRSSAIKSRIITLPPAFLSYLRADGIVLPPETSTAETQIEYQIQNQNQVFPSSIPENDDWDEDPDADPSLDFPDLHQQIIKTIADLGGLVAPKLNWSAPKDATWISMKKNSMECATANDIYLLLKSSDFITHDLEHAFDDTALDGEITQDSINFVLVLRKWFKANPSCEFRCFVRQRRVIGICQRDLNHFDFLFPLREKIRDTILEFFDRVLKHNFPEDDFVFDIYLPEPYDKVRLMDINPWAPRTDPLLFSWLELLRMSPPAPLLGKPDANPLPVPQSSSDEDTQDDEFEEMEDMWKPELRLVRKNDPEAYSFASPQYSAHKLPREVVEAGMSGEGGIRDFMGAWQGFVENGAELGENSSEDDEVTTSCTASN